MSAPPSPGGEAYRRGVERLLAAEANALALLDEAAAQDPGLVGAHAALSLVHRDRGDAQRWKHHAERAIDLAADTATAEASGARALASFALGRPTAVDELGGHLDRFPADSLALEVLSRHLFFHGGAGRRARLVNLLERVAPAHADGWYYPAKRAFHLQEVHRYEEARLAAERSLALRPANAPAVHALAHTLHGLGLHDRALPLLESYLQVASGAGAFDGHLAWHAAILHLGTGNVSRARELFAERVRPSRSPGSRQLALADAVGLLSAWRLAGAPQSPSWDEAHALAGELARAPGRPFVDIHAAVAFGGAGDHASLSAFARAVEEVARTSPLASSGAVVVGAVLDLAEGRPDAALARLDALGDQGRDALGGSNVERALVDELRVEALRTSGRWPSTRGAFAESVGADSRAHPGLARLLASSESTGAATPAADVGSSRSCAH